ncbi:MULTISPECIES: hypothetical protein [Pseudomonadaceae]|uniref:hypothetical protein n=1 Tax=Pseudomonadaceae TaxID=135621 RepID=UPI0015E2AE2D|nr:MULTISPECIES: hypothetical protein [Pseudomonadaceae]MBA1280568.1 hypothetical protein [Stutzerimonas stutzeri]MBH8610670.1 hypothetical protein [Pseudomonas mohnii]
MNTIFNTRFLDKIEPEARAMVLDDIAERYGITPDEAYKEVTSDGAEHLLDYLVEPLRGATQVLMQKHAMA